MVCGADENSITLSRVDLLQTGLISPAIFTLLWPSGPHLVCSAAAASAALRSADSELKLYKLVRGAVGCRLDGRDEEEVRPSLKPSDIAGSDVLEFGPLRVDNRDGGSMGAVVGVGKDSSTVATVVGEESGL